VGPSEKGRRWPYLSVLFALSLGALAGAGTTTFRYAEGLSYFKTDPQACANCHIMQPNLDSWQQSSHHTAAVCVDCHLPQAFVPKYLAKAENGWRHGKLFTTGGFVEPIRVQAVGRKILQANCEHCHAELTAQMRAGEPGHGRFTQFGAPAGLPCIHCHASVGHGPPAGIGGPPSREELSR
jgi:cytochrome c nitrite reductase small subunit